MNLQKTLAVRLANAAAQSYRALPDAGTFINSPATDTQVLVLMDAAERTLIFAFRGTADFRDALTDAEIILRGAPELPEASGRLHTGVCRAVESVIPQIAKVCRQVPEWRVYFTGHSLGGALAPLAAYLMAQQGFTVAGVVTFAGMRFCDGTFRDNYNALLGDRTARITAQYDPVPHLPLPGWLLPYRHVGSEFYFTGGQMLGGERTALDMIIDDGLTLYQAWRILQGDPLALPRQIIQVHGIQRYQGIVSTLP